MDDLTIFQIISLLILLAAVFGYLNERFLRLPSTIGIILIALFSSFIVIAIDILLPSTELAPRFRSFVDRIDFHKTLMEVMLGLLLFAGALHVDIESLLKRKWAISLMATLGIIFSTIFIGATFSLISGLLDFTVPFVWCLIFGALISPTDPVAVLGIFKSIKIPGTTKAMISGESLFNDGVGVVVFTMLVIISSSGKMDFSSYLFIGLKYFLKEACGGALVGLLAGWFAYRTMKSIDEHNTEVLITLALVLVTYSFATFMHVSGPIAVVIAGLLIGNHGSKFAMSQNTSEYVQKFWDLIDEILNAVLFLLIGLEVLLLHFKFNVLLLALIFIPIILLSRFLSVSSIISILSLRRKYKNGTIPILTWGGIRGGISVALVLSLPDGVHRDLLLSITYIVVIFSIIVQGLTIEKLIKRYMQNDA